MAWHFEWRQTWSEVWAEEFQKTWLGLLANDAQSQIYHRPQLVRAWTETIGAALSVRPMIGFATDSAGRQILLPWVLVDYAGSFLRRRVLEPAGQSLFGYHDPVVAGPNLNGIEWPAFWETVRRQVGHSYDQALFRFVHARYAGGPLTEPSGEESHVLNLGGLLDLEGALARCSSNHRTDVRRRLRRLSEIGEVTLWVAESDEVSAILRDLHDRFLPAYGAIWRMRPSGNMFDRPGFVDFVERVVSDGVASGWAHYAVLQVAGKSIAWHLGLIDRCALYWWIPAYDPAWENFSPGKILLARLIQHGLARSWTHIHFLTGAHRYKLDWKPVVEDLRTLRWHAPTLRGSLLAWYDAHRRPEIAHVQMA